MADLYSKEVMDHFNNPRNVGDIKDADGIGDTGNPTCGDVMRLYIKVGRRPTSLQPPASSLDGKEGQEPGGMKQEADVEEYIEDVKFQTFGCGAAVASSSMVTELVKGKSLKDAEELSAKAVADALGGLPPQKLHCSNLGAKALHEAIKDYKSKKK